MVVMLQHCMLCHNAVLQLLSFWGYMLSSTLKMGGSMFHLNVSFHQQDYKVSQIGRP